MVKLLGRELWQWDVGRKVEITQPDGYTVNEVHFAKKGDTDALVVLLQNNIAEIPNNLLQDARLLFVYLVMADGETEQTLKVATFAVTPKPKPTDYVYTETEVFRWETLEEKMDALETQNNKQSSDISKLKTCNSVDLGTLYDSAEEDAIDLIENTSYALCSALRGTPIGFKRQIVFVGNFEEDWKIRGWVGTLSRFVIEGTPVGVFEGNSTDNNFGIRVNIRGFDINTEIFECCISEHPEMLPLVEYMTAEKWNGKPVYTMMLDFGALPNAKTKYCYFDQTMSDVVNIECIVKRTTSKGRVFSYPACALSTIAEYWVRHDGADNYFAIKTTDDLSAEYTAKVVIKYIK